MAGTQPDNSNTDLLPLIARGTASAVGEEFLRTLVRHLALALQVRYAFLAEFAEVRSRVRMLGYWEVDHFGTCFEYDIAGTPCEQVLAGEIRCFPACVQDLFPNDQVLVDLGVESYMAIPLIDPHGEVLGHLAIMNDQPMTETPPNFDVFQIFAARAGAELLRKRAEEDLRRTNERLTGVLASAMDAIVTIDAQRHIVLFNPAAERIFGCAAAWAAGQPFERFLSRRFRHVLDDMVAPPPSSKSRMQQVWLPPGITAQRMDGKEFPIEATLSPLTLGNEHFYTVILRDVSERERIATELEHLKDIQSRAYQESELAETGQEGLLGDSPPMRRLRTEIEVMAAADSTVLITGETGTGKEKVAHALHALSARRDRPLIKMNCAALPSELIESELFGHEKGAFTGATSQRKGRFELADAGTLFLDEVGELSPTAQAKLLRVLQEQEFERVGGNRTIKVDVRVIAATNRDLSALVDSGRFRADLFYRLDVLRVDVPPLRERASDIPLLAHVFLRHYARRLGKPYTDIVPQAIGRLQRYSWPGNVRELQNVIERSVVIGRPPTLDVDEAFMVGAVRPGVAAPADGTLDEVQGAHIRKVLEETGWVIEGKDGAAAKLRIEPSTLRYRMQKLGIKRPRHGSEGGRGSG